MHIYILLEGSLAADILPILEKMPQLNYVAISSSNACFKVKVNFVNVWNL